MSAPAQGSVKDDRTRLKVKVFYTFVEQDGYVVKFSGHWVGCPPKSPGYGASRGSGEENGVPRNALTATCTPQ